MRLGPPTAADQTIDWQLRPGGRDLDWLRPGRHADDHLLGAGQRRRRQRRHAEPGDHHHRHQRHAGDRAPRPSASIAESAGDARPRTHERSAAASPSPTRIVGDTLTASVAGSPSVQLQTAVPSRWRLGRVAALIGGRRVHADRAGPPTAARPHRLQLRPGGRQPGLPARGREPDDHLHGAGQRRHGNSGRRT